MRFDYTFQHTCPRTGAPIWSDYECKIDAVLIFPNGDPEVVLIDAAVQIIECGKDDAGNFRSIVVDEPSLYDGDYLSQELADLILHKAEQDEPFIRMVSAVLQAESGISYAGRGSNDPDGHYRRVSL